MAWSRVATRGIEFRYRHQTSQRYLSPSLNGWNFPLDTSSHSAVWAITMKLNRTIRRACLRRRSSDDGLRRVRRQR